MSCTCSSVVLNCTWYCCGAVIGGSPTHGASARAGAGKNDCALTARTSGSKPRPLTELSDGHELSFASFASFASLASLASFAQSFGRSPGGSSRTAGASDAAYSSQVGLRTGNMGDTFCKHVKPTGHALERDVIDQSRAKCLKPKRTLRALRSQQKTGVPMQERYRAGRVEGDGSRAPHSRPHAVSPDVMQPLVAPRKKHPRWGPRKLLVIVPRLYPRGELPAATTVGAMLKEAGADWPSTTPRP